MSSFQPSSLPDLTGKVFIVTGGNSGIGYYTVSHLAAHGAHVYLGSRSLDKGNTAIESIRALHPNLQLNITLLQIDLADLSSVVAAAERFLSLETRIDGLINNAGIMATPVEMTINGHEAQWQTNYLAHWLLTTRLLPLMLQTAKEPSSYPGSVRIVNLTSSGHLTAPKCGIDLSDPSLQAGTPWNRYGQTKLANILHAKTLHKLYGPGSPSALAGEGEIWTTAVHPGPVETNISSGQSGGIEMRVLAVYRFLGLVWGADKGSWNTLFCAASGDMKVEQSGGYIDVYNRCGELWWESAKAKDGELAERLEAWTGEVMARDGWLR